MNTMSPEWKIALHNLQYRYIPPIDYNDNSRKKCLHCNAPFEVPKNNGRKLYCTERCKIAAANVKNKLKRLEEKKLSAGETIPQRPS